MNQPIHFKGTAYASLESMPPAIRAAYEQSQRDRSHNQSGQGGEARDDQPPQPAWSGGRPAGGAPVPAGFETVTGLGPAVAAQKYDWTGILPNFGTPRAHELVRYRDGFAYRAGGKDIHTWRWDEVAVIQSHISRSAADSNGIVSMTREFTLTNTKGDKVILDGGLSNVSAEAAAIKHEVFARLGPALAQRYQADEALTFGVVTVQRQNGLQLDGKLFAWNAIAEVQVKAGQFQVTLSDGKTHAARVSAIPNIELLCQVIGAKLSAHEL